MGVQFAATDLAVKKLVAAVFALSTGTLRK
jgi:hypothetical protein